MVSKSREEYLFKRGISRLKINEKRLLMENILMNLEQNKLYFDEVTDLISGYFGLNRKDIKSKSRQGRIVMARGFIIYFIYKHLFRKMPNETLIYRLIGTYLARDRITIRYHQKQMHFLIEKDREYKQHHFNLYIKLVSYDII